MTQHTPDNLTRAVQLIERITAKQQNAFCQSAGIGDRVKINVVRHGDDGNKETGNGIQS